MTRVSAVPRRWPFRALAALLAVAASLAAAEAFLRVTRVGAYEERRSDYHLVRPGDGTLWMFDPLERPPEQSWDRDPYGRLPPGQRMTYVINGAGLRGPLPAPGRDAVVVMGDSFTFGEGVPHEQTFVARVEESLAKAMTRPPSLVNAAVPGYGTKQELARLPHWLDEFHPRAVVVVFLLNDVVPDGLWPSPDDLPPPTAADEAEERSGSALWRLLRNVAARPRVERDLQQWYRSFYLGGRGNCWATSRAAIAQMRDLCRAKDVAFALVLFPMLHRLAENPFADVHAAVGRACAEMQIPFLDLTPALAVEPDRELWLHPVDHHPDARAHELAAAAMAPFVESLLK